MNITIVLNDEFGESKIATINDENLRSIIITVPDVTEVVVEARYNTEYDYQDRLIHLGDYGK